MTQGQRRRSPCRNVFREGWSAWPHLSVKQKSAKWVTDEEDHDLSCNGSGGGRKPEWDRGDWKKLALVLRSLERPVGKFAFLVRHEMATL